MRYDINQRVEIVRGPYKGQFAAITGVFSDGDYSAALDNGPRYATFEPADLDIEAPMTPTFMPAPDTVTLSADDLLTMELYFNREGNLTPAQAATLLSWAKDIRPHVEAAE